MAPLIPFWQQPSHGDIQEVIINDEAFTSKSLCTTTVPPFGLFAKLSFPPCTPASEPTYATVQTGRSTHLNLNSDLVYINHSCEPSVTFDMSSFAIFAGPKGLKPGDELTFFYPSTEWNMAQGFDCFCGTATCRGRIEGAGKMTDKALEGLWLNGYIREMRAEMATKERSSLEASNGEDGGADKVEQALRKLMEQAKESVKLAEESLKSYNAAKAQGTGQADHRNGNGNGHSDGDLQSHGTLSDDVTKDSASAVRQGPTSRELSGEMGGDTVAE